MDIKKEIKIVLTHMHLIIIAVIALHIAVPLTLSQLNLSFFDTYSAVQEGEEEYFEVELNQKQDQAELASQAAQNSEGEINVISPDIYVLRFSTEKKQDQVADVLQMLAASPVRAEVPLKAEKITKKSLSGFGFQKRSYKKRKAAEVKYERILSKDEIVNMEINNLKNKVTALNKNFQKCYISEQTQDELLTGKISILIKNRKPIIFFNGVGKNSSIKNLKGCVNNKLSSLAIPSSLSGKSFKFNVNLTGQ